MNKPAIFLAAFALYVCSALGYGPWLEWTPLGGVEIDDAGLPRMAKRAMRLASAR